MECNGRTFFAVAQSTRGVKSSASGMERYPMRSERMEIEQDVTFSV
jgi:hypothetical protein